MIKRALALLLLSVLVLTSCASEPEYPYSHAELVLPLTEEFYAVEDKSYDAAFTDGEITVAAIRVSFAAALETGIPDTLSAKHFARYWLIETGHSTDVAEYMDIAYTDYTVDDAYHMVAFYRTRYAYFVILFAAPDAIYLDARPRFIEIMKGVWFTHQIQ